LRAEPPKTPHNGASLRVGQAALVAKVHQNPNFPQAVYVSSIRAWFRAAIERFNETWDRKGGWQKGRSRKASQLRPYY
jgi:hypothetical protein